MVSVADGQRIISDPKFYENVQQEDFDNNGYKDVAVSLWSGGNCCDPTLKNIFLNLGQQRFAEIEIPTNFGWEFYQLGAGYGVKLFDLGGAMSEYIISKNGLMEIAKFQKAKFFYDFDEVYDLHPFNGRVPKFVEEVELDGFAEPDDYRVWGFERVFEGNLNENEVVDEIQCFRSDVTATKLLFVSHCRIMIDGEATHHVMEKKGDRTFAFSVIGIDRMKNGRAKVYLGSQEDSKNEFYHLPMPYE